MLLRMCLIDLPVGTMIFQQINYGSGSQMVFTWKQVHNNAFSNEIGFVIKIQNK